MSQAYKIKEITAHDIYERGETCVFDIEIRAIPSGTLTNCTDVDVTFTDMCNTKLLDEQSMASDATGKYFYNYSIPSDTLYGKYNITYKCVDAAGLTSKKRSSLFIFSYDLVDKIKRLSGITTPSVSNEDVASIALEAMDEVLDEVYEFHKDVRPICDPDNCVLFNGTNTTVRTPYKHLADHNYDGNVYGIGNLDECDEYLDIYGYWIDSDYAKQTAKITVVDATTGRITITQTDDSAIPSDNHGVFITFWTEWESFNSNLLEDAIAYLAAHNLILRMTEAHRTTAADLPSNQRKIELNLRRFEIKYEKIMEKISRPKCDGI